MSVLLPELEPVAVRLSALLIPLMRLCGLMVVLGIIFAADAFVRAIFGTATGAIGWIPYANKLVSTPLHKIEQKITNYLGGLETHIDASMGEFFHNLAAVTDQLATGQAEAAWATMLVAKALHSKHAPARLVPQIKHAQATATHADAVAVRAAREAHAHGGRLAATAPAAVLPRVKGLEGELGHVLEWDLPRLRARTRTVERSLDRLWRRVRGLDKTIATGVFVGAVAIALGRLKLGWLRCSNWKRAGRAVCGMDPSLLESLLADSLLIVGSLSLVELGKELQPIVGESARLVQGFWRIG